MKNRIITLLFASLMLMIAGVTTTGCDDGKTYVEKLADERKAIKKFMADKKTSTDLPEDNKFDPEIYYSLGDGVYMQVERLGNLEVKAEKGAIVKFRHKRTDLFTMETQDVDWNVSAEYSDYLPSRFIYGKPELSSSVRASSPGIQLPLEYVGEDAIVRVLVPSKMGMSLDEANVIPVLYLIRYTDIINR